MNETNSQFGSAVTPPHQPQLLTSPSYGEEKHPVLGETTPPVIGEKGLQTIREGYSPGVVEGEATASVTTLQTRGRTSAFITGETPDERYRCDICGEEVSSQAELERHIERIGVLE